MWSAIFLHCLRALCILIIISTVIYHPVYILEQFFRPTMEEMMNIERLFATADTELAMEQRQATLLFILQILSGITVLNNILFNNKPKLFIYSPTQLFF